MNTLRVGRQTTTPPPATGIDRCTPTRSWPSRPKMGHLSLPARGRQAPARFTSSLSRFCERPKPSTDRKRSEIGCAQMVTVPAAVR
jgi:hypothetical protein